ncbi:hypothetical protein TSMEX_010480 [Taenia solium]|eukprot:TsM_000390800 transcript=TsM_000390800 gene=TsM_000390800
MRKSLSVSWQEWLHQVAALTIPLPPLYPASLTQSEAIYQYRGHIRPLTTPLFVLSAKPLVFHFDAFGSCMGHVDFETNANSCILCHDCDNFCIRCIWDSSS